VILRMTATEGGTSVEMYERPDGVTAFLTLNPLVHVLTRKRNEESLRRLEELALRH
jgi:hypothetical protein